MVLFVLISFWCVLRLLLSPDVELNPGPVGRSRDCRVLYANVRGLHGNLKDLTVQSREFDVLLCSETLVSDRRHLSELAIPGFGKPQQILQNERSRSRGLVAYVRNGFIGYRQKKYECRCCESLVIRVCGRLMNFYIFALYRNPDLDDKLYDCLLEAMAKIQSVDSKASFVFVGDLNAHHSEWLGSTRTTEHGVAAFDFSTVSGCSQLVREPTHVRGGVLDLVLTDVPDLVGIQVRPPVGTSDHSAIGMVITTSQRVQDFSVRREIYLKGRTNWDAVRDDVSNLPWGEVLSSRCPVVDLNRRLLEIVQRRVPVRTILIRSCDKPWFDTSCIRACQAKQEVYNGWKRNRTDAHWNAYVECRRHSAAVYATAEREFNVRSRNVLASEVSSHKWWATLKSAVFGSDSSLPPLLDTGGSLVNSPIEKANLLNRHFDSKQCRDGIELPLTCHPEVSFSSFAFRSNEILRLLSSLDPYGGSDPLGFFPLFYKRIADLLSRKLAVIFRMLIRGGSFPQCWRTANVVPVPKGASSPVVENYRPISLTPILSKVFERLIAVRFSRFLEVSAVLPPCQFAYRKGLGTCDALLTVAHHLQSTLDKGGEARLVQLDFSAAFDRVNHRGLLYKLRSLGVGGSMLRIVEHFLTDRKQRVILDGCCGSDVDVVSGVPQGSVLGPLLFVVYTADMFSVVENRLVNYADDSTLYAAVPRPSLRPDVTASLNLDLLRIQEWCRSWNMLMNPLKTKSLVVSRSRTVAPRFGDIVLDGAGVEVSDDLVILGVRFDSKLTFESHIRDVVASSSRSLGIMRRAAKIFDSTDVLVSCFRSFVLSRLEYCAPVWNSATNVHLNLIDRVVRRADEMCDGVLDCDLRHRRDVSSLCMLYKVWQNESHPLHCELVRHIPLRVTRGSAVAHPHCLSVPRWRTLQFSRGFVPRTILVWNSMIVSVFHGDGLAGFKSRVNRFLLSR